MTPEELAALRLGDRNGPLPDDPDGPPCLVPVDVAALLAAPPPPRDDLLVGFLERGDLFMVVGPGGAGKSILALALGVHVVTVANVPGLTAPFDPWPQIARQRPWEAVRRVGIRYGGNSPSDRPTTVCHSPPGPPAS